MRTGVDLLQKHPALRVLLAVLLLALPQAACAMKDMRDWTAFKAAYVAADGRVVDTGNGGVSHSEGQGYGMLPAEAHGDRATFDRLWGWTGVNLVREDARLFRWRYDPKAAQAVADPAGPWSRLIRDGLTVARDTQFGADALPADWVRIDASGAVTPDPSRPPRFGFDAVRAPLYLVWGGVTSQAPATTAGRFWRRYEGANWPPPAWVDVQSGDKAAFPLSPGGQAVARLVADLPAQKHKPMGEDYYSAALGLLARQAAKERRPEGASQGLVRF